MQYHIENIECVIKWFLLSDVSDSDVTFAPMYNLYLKKKPLFAAEDLPDFQFTMRCAFDS